MSVSKPFRWIFLCWLLGAVGASGQAYRTPVRTSWTEDPATSVTMAWDTVEEGRGTVRWGTAPDDLSRTAHDGGGVHRHEIVLRDLLPGTRYFYEALSADGGTQSGTFRTAPGKGQPLHFVFHGDLQGGINESGAQGVADRIVQEDPALVVSLGDMAEEAFSGSGFETWDVFFRICSNELSRTVYMPIMGNHDAAPGSDYTRGLFHRLFSLPDPSPGHGHYAYGVGNVRFIALNTEISADGQNDWLARELQAAANDTNADWIVALCHRPPYSWGERAGDEHYRTNWGPLLTCYEANWLVSGHSHNYQRMVPIRGVRYLVGGGGGASLYASAVDQPAQAFATTCYHYVSAQVTNDTMQLRGIRSDGRIFDTVVVTNRRQVRIAPAFPVRGEKARIFYRATEGPLAAADPVYIHLGQDAFSNAFADAAMTWNAAAARWEYEFTVPAAATQRVAFVFHNGAGVWHNNYDCNWQALLARAGLVPDPPAAGSKALLRYEADMGPLAGATPVTAWVATDGGAFATTGGVRLTNTSGARWEGEVEVPATSRRLSVVFSSGTGWDDDFRRTWTFAVTGATARAWPPAPVAGAGSPTVTDDPEGALPDNIGDNVDLAAMGPPLLSRDSSRGFGDFGSLWFNVDATHLYLGGFGADLGGSNNVFMVFLGVDTLADNAWNLWHKTGLPNALDFLHNVRFTEPMDVALVLGDTYGDGPAYTNFTYGGHDFGQGVYYVGTNWNLFVPMASAKLSQFHGTGTVATATQGSGDSRRTQRWEAALPWSALNAAGPESVSHLFVCGVIASASISGNDRYLSRTVLGARAWGQEDAYGQYGFNTVYVCPLRVNFLHGDLRGDGISNAWRQEYFGTPDGPPAGEDTDGDGQDNRAEEIAGTRPNDRGSFFAVEADAPSPGIPFMLRWPFVPLRQYDIDFTPDLRHAFEPLVTGLEASNYPPVQSGFYRLRVRK